MSYRTLDLPFYTASSQLLSLNTVPRYTGIPCHEVTAANIRVILFSTSKMSFSHQSFAASLTEANKQPHHLSKF